MTAAAPISMPLPEDRAGPLLLPASPAAVDGPWRLTSNREFALPQCSQKRSVGPIG